jgi:hypothetical protein
VNLVGADDDHWQCAGPPAIYVEYVAGPNGKEREIIIIIIIIFFLLFFFIFFFLTTGLNHTEIAQRAAVLANASAFTSFFISSGYVTDFPFDLPEFIPWINGIYLAISIGVACGLFVITILGCVTFYCIKSSRQVYGSVMGQTDSTASVQSGSSMRSAESTASATAD